MRVLSQKTIEEILNSLDKSIAELAKGVLENIESQNNFQDVENFLSSQYEIRLQNLLKAKNTDIHYLESGIKNLVIQRKQKILEEVFNQYQN